MERRGDWIGKKERKPRAMMEVLILMVAISLAMSLTPFTTYRDNVFPVIIQRPNCVVQPTKMVLLLAERSVAAARPPYREFKKVAVVKQTLQPSKRSEVLQVS